MSATIQIFISTMKSEIRIESLTTPRDTIDSLAQLLIDTVAHRGSIGFMHPVTPAKATAFWKTALAAARRGSRVVLGAYDGIELIGTVTLLLDCPENQPHRAEIAKMMTKPDHRGRGVASALLHEAEQIAIGKGRTLLTLDTAEQEGAAGLYEKMGYQRTGIIPDYALMPYGGLTGTIIYWKRIGG
jgi:ribosomal protein S18 acetylase RimI-like enzyme